MNAEKALGITLSTPAGYVAMHRYNDALTELNRAMSALELLYGKRPSKAREEACERLSMAEGKVLALREVTAYMVVHASGYTISKHKAIQAMDEEHSAIAEAHWLAPIGIVRMRAFVTRLYPLLNN